MSCVKRKACVKVYSLMTSAFFCFCVCVCVYKHITTSALRACVSLDALPAALQSSRETASAEVVHSHVRAGEEEDHPGHDLHGVVTTTPLL